MQYCHPHLRSSVRTASPVDEAYYKNCLEQYDSGPTPDACTHNGRTFHCETDNMQLKDCDGIDEKEDLVCHCCPVEKTLCCTDCSHLKNDKISRAQVVLSDGEVHHPVPGPNGIEKCEERPCCVRNNSWTEQRICRCSQPDSPMCPECECGAKVVLEEPCHEKQDEKHVRFSDEVKVHDDGDCENLFRSLNESDIKQLCPCCKVCAVKGTDQCIGRPVLVYELPEPKFEGTSVTQKDYSWKKIPERGLPPWHPLVKDSWYRLPVPSIAETTYQSDFKPPFVAQTDREPVYLAPRKEKEIDPCRKLAQEFASWQKTSTGDKHTYHSSCVCCDRDLHRVHLHECDASHLPPQYQCHGDGHICQPTDCDAGERFALCDRGDTEDSRYWWKRTCCESKAVDPQKSSDLPKDLMKTPCPSYTTSYKHDFKDPKKLQNERSLLGKAWEYCTNPYADGQPNLLCTKDTREPFISQRAGII